MYGAEQYVITSLTKKEEWNGGVAVWSSSAEELEIAVVPPEAAGDLAPVPAKLAKLAIFSIFFCRILQTFGGLLLGCIKTKFCKKICV